MSNLDDARKRLGELLLIGFNGLELSDDTAAFLSQAGIGGVILFSHNYDSPAQVTELINQIQECRGEYPLWVSVDQEGGKVQRFRKPFTRFPEARDIGDLTSPKAVFEISEAIAKELKAVGVNLNFYPVADIMTNPKNEVIGSRAYGENESIVSQMVSAAVRGHLIGGVQPCVKHFPGHGDTSTDSHMALPKVDVPWEELRDREIKPFIKAFKSRCAFVMTAHILNRAIDSEFPATLSKKTLQDYLRNDVRYSKIIISDDMEMNAITDHYGAEEAPRLAIEAGCDILIYRSEEAARKAYASLDRDLSEGKLSPERVLEAADLIREVKKSSLAGYSPIKTTEITDKIGTDETASMIDGFLG